MLPMSGSALSLIARAMTFASVFFARTKCAKVQKPSGKLIGPRYAG